MLLNILIELLSILFDILEYIKWMLPFAIVAALIFRCFSGYRKTALTALGFYSSKKREVCLTIFVMWIFGILAMTLRPTFVWSKQGEEGIWGDILILIERPSWDTNLDFIPGSVFYTFLKQIIVNQEGLSVFYMIFNLLLNLFGNIALFIPIGFFPALLFRNATWKRSAIIGFGMSLFIEIGQYFIMRNTAVDDVILNTLGALCGYWLYLTFKHHKPAQATSFLPQPTENISL